MSKRLKRGLTKFSTHGLLIGYTVYLVFPLLWMLSTSLKTTPEIYSGAPTILPRELSWEHYESVIKEEVVLKTMINSFYVALFSTIVVVIIALPAAYAVARYQTKLNRAILGWIVTSQVFPAILIMIPLYVILRNLKLTDSLLGLSLVYVVWDLPFVLWMLHGYVKSIPIELEESAILDGATKSQFVYRVLTPVLLPAIAAAALFAFISGWNEFFFALVLMKSPESITLPVELARFTGMEGQARTGPLSAASFLATIPSIFLFGVMRKWFAAGLTAGALKD